MNLLLATAFTLLLSLGGSIAQSESEMIQEFFDNLKSRKYNPLIGPEGYDGYGTPVRVFSTMYLIDIHKIDDSNMEYRASFYFRQKWNDSRLAYLDMDISSIVLNDHQMVWTPDLFFIQFKEGIKHDIVTKNVFLKISPEGQVFLSTRLSVTFSCEMDFKNYPHDSQRCTFSVESYGKTAEQLWLDWDPTVRKPVEKADKINILPFELTNISCWAKSHAFSFGNYRELGIELTFHRLIGFYVIRLYIPFILLVIISWLSFWIKPKFSVLRLPLLLAIMYIMIQIASDLNGTIPPASYTKASDIWIAVCESLVFGAFLEYILVSILAKAEKKFQKKRCSNSSDPEAPIISSSDAKEKSSSSEKTNISILIVSSRLAKTKRLSQMIDHVSSILFPISFAVFNIIYWMVY